MKIYKYASFVVLLSFLVMPLLGGQTALAATALQISGIQTFNIDSTSATVYWNTNVATDSLVKYSNANPVPANAPQVYSSSLVNNHQVQLTNLTPNTYYYYNIKSCTGRRNSCASVNGLSFKTLTVSQQACDPVPPLPGSWTKVNSPNVSSNVVSVNHHLLGVAAVSDNNVWTVGWSTNPNGPQFAEQTLIEHFDGSSWKIVPSPNTNDPLNELYSISAVSANDIWAVGKSENPSSLPSKSLIEHWNGSSWTIVPSPSVYTANNILRGVAAISANNVWAVGFSQNTDNAVLTFILHWDGTTWTQVFSPNPNSSLTSANQLTGITAISANDIWAVGKSGASPLSLHWNGTTWSAVAVPTSTGDSLSAFQAVSGSVTNDIWAVGFADGLFVNNRRGMIQRFDGTSWIPVLCINGTGGPGITAANFQYNGVSASTANNVWIVGDSDGTPLVLHWDGTSLVIVPTATFSAAYTRLDAITASSATTAWGVGDYGLNTTTPPQTLIEKYSR